MEKFNVYNDISVRTNGEIYIGVVGPVRTGKSTFIKRFMELLVLPGMEDVHSKERTRDELPQSAAGKTIMTTEPKFIPKEAASIQVGDGIEVNVRMIDCVGYMVDGAVGHTEEDQERLVKTPWFDYEIPFTQAAEVGTKKVINDHSTIGVVVTTDGSIGDLGRQSYIGAEEKTIAELKKLGKPFIILLNCVKPLSEEAVALGKELEMKYSVNVLPVNCEQLKKDDITKIMEEVLLEFPVTELDFHIPKWVEILPNNHWLKSKLIELAKTVLGKITWMKDVNERAMASNLECVKNLRIDRKDLSDGSISIDVQIDPSYYYQIISDYVGLPIKGEYQLMRTLLELAKLKTEYQKVEEAMDAVKFKGYGVVTPNRNEIVLDEPQVIKHGNKFGVKMKAEAPSIHLIKSFIETEIAPIVGSEQQAQDLIAYIKETAKSSEEGIWETNIFGKSIEQIVDDGINAKISQMTDECQMKLQDTLQKIINDSNGGMICIII
ncbi:MAG: stage IV sporulation protein A [Lachnospiraceae bacterium]